MRVAVDQIARPVFIHEFDRTQIFSIGSRRKERDGQIFIPQQEEEGLQSLPVNIDVFYQTQSQQGADKRASSIA
ncbi:hypothetical protein HKBW3S03_00168 [Candidatus Hakubella thermalkaliphila]|uniref:Uncharacterized protein n=1 Tax=Candidatus Hakubella thermalkaliphila TaxID=2754717 RepID=A0A6V8Q335_9ACTN|nr:hypothetical protein HKBW3S03_00168 [Candidatus Hakubella thermalkaliphila]GFP22813.1 hypothetical protein HKBW3S09_00280 [Candidatus Hakubella thermalkaliphila]GFP29315.1 hypothetical protein HKBW3S34_00235 [Candidatus Hakubella thermalkaliphila]GFP37806.1 hypothetical protein HKBW3S44_01486 [Candidatus Hakubella thermalkaliphila]GFP38969.1 hypothetical protein HKBW3S47_00669 [Candidatus Hakubella thermalkaliphila]